MGCSEPDISSHPQEESDYTMNFQRHLDWILMCKAIVEAQKIPLPKGVRQNMTLRESVKVQKGSSFEKRLVVIDTEHEYQSPIPSSIDKNQVEIDCEECETPKFYSVSKFEMDVDGEQELQSPNVPCVDVPEAGMAMKGEEYIYVVPQVGVEFESEDHPYNCYSRYAVLEGFSIRKDFVNKSRINGIVVSRRYTCHLEFPEEKYCGVELRFCGVEFDKALLLSHLQRHFLLQLRRSKAVLGKVRLRTDDTCCSKRCCFLYSCCFTDSNYPVPNCNL